jgi:hypothetical protein
VLLSRHSTIVVALLASMLLVGTAANAGGLVPDPVKTGVRDQFGGTGNADYFAWTQDRPGTNFYDVYFEPIGGAKVQVNNAGNAFSHAVDQTGSLLTWQRIKKGNSDVRLYDMATQMDVPLPSGINTDKWEWGSGIFGNTFTFVRWTKANHKLFLVTDLTTGDKIKFATVDYPKVDMFTAPRLYGNWIVWWTFTKKAWKAYRYDITNGTTMKIPNPLGKFYYAPSVDLAGNVYFIRSGNGCAANVKLMKWTGGGGSPTIEYEFDDQTDVFTTSVFDDGLGTVTLFVDFLDCSSFKNDIYSFTNP